MGSELTSAQVTANALDSIQVDGLADGDRSRLLIRDAARRLLARVETPSEQAERYNLENPAIHTAIQVFIDLSIWEGWLSSGGGRMTPDDLAKLSVPLADVALLRRILRVLTAGNIVKEAGVDAFESTPFSEALGDKDGNIWKTIQAGTDHYHDSLRNTPPFLKQTGYKEPRDASSTPYTEMLSNPAHLSFFERCESNAGFNESFNGHMADLTRWKCNWTDMFDTKALLDGADLTQGPFIVDMGGHFGIDLSRVLEKHPSLPDGALVLEDLPYIIEEAKTKVSPKIRTQVFDLFQPPQPVKHSRAYFMHAVLHDWPDDAVLRILENLKPAMKRGYSKLLINDQVIPPTGATLFQTTIDLLMMAMLASQERTQQQWSELLTRAGFTNIRFYSDDIGLEGVVEADLL